MFSTKESTHILGWFGWSQQKTGNLQRKTALWQRKFDQNEKKQLIIAYRNKIKSFSKWPISESKSSRKYIHSLSFQIPDYRVQVYTYV